MSFWHRLLFLLGLRPDPGPRRFEVSAGLHTTLSTLARQSGQPEQDLAETIFAAGLDSYYARDVHWAVWQKLTPRERDVTALTCLGCTNRQMAARLGISTETVKTHIANALRKFRFASKADMRVELAGWDFSAWADWPPSGGGLAR